MRYTYFQLLALCLLTTAPALAQRAAGSLGSNVGSLIAANEFSKEESLYRAKEFAFQLLGPTEKPEKFEMWALAAATSGELTSLVYNSDAKQREGLVLAFYGNRLTETGAVYKAYGFKELPKQKAAELLAKLEATLEENKGYLSKDADNNNVVFKYDDMTFLLYNVVDPHIRVFWGQFDADWNVSSFRKTKRRMEKKI